MNAAKKVLLCVSVSLGIALSTGLACAAGRPYDPTADARSQIHAALDTAATSRRPVLLIFGANWCEDCLALDKAMKTGRNAELIGRDFTVVKIDVGNFNHNLDIADAYGNPIKKGIPAAVVLSPDNQVLYATRGGELADARRMSEDGIYELFSKAAGAADDKPAH